MLPESIDDWMGPEKHPIHSLTLPLRGERENEEINLRRKEHQSRDRLWLLGLDKESSESTRTSPSSPGFILSFVPRVVLEFSEHCDFCSAILA
ncbi:hypothetical protein VNO77_02718 [Canavalia gladiata]|uniref:Uncharacterized protein n=1 Tax=Canavalia gladiata TaxID=3824 RepID=A0AAN9R7H1_CANGL